MSNKIMRAAQTVRPYAILLACSCILSACNSSSSDNAPANDDSTTSPSIPGDLTFDVYSPEAIELFWTPSTDDGLVIGYNIIRDGMLIKNQLDANSFVDDTLEPATTYQYSVVAVDNDGNHSLPSNIEITTHDAPVLPSLISLSNHVELLNHIFDIYTGSIYGAAIFTLPDWSDPAYDGYASADPSLVETSVTCLNGGTALFIPINEYDGYSRGEEGWNFVFDNCQDDTDVLDGLLFRRRILGPFFVRISVESDGFSINGQLRQVYFFGQVNKTFSGLYNASWESLGIDYTASDGLTSLALSDASTSFSYDDILINPDPRGRAAMDGSFTVSSDVTGQRSLHVEVLDEFVLDISSDEQLSSYAGIPWHFEAGQLELTGDDGSKLVLNADNDDYQSVLIEISNADGSTESFTQPWSLWTERLRIYR